MSVWDRATFEEKYAAVCVLLGVLYLAIRQETHETEDYKRRRQRDSITLEEEALARLERGEALELPRWHGDRLELRAAPSTSAATSDRDRRRARPDTADRGRRRPATSGQDGAGDDADQEDDDA